MKRNKLLLAIAITIALGVGVWTLAVTFTDATFSPGDMLSASALNTLLNDNFNAAKVAIEQNEADITALESSQPGVDWFEKSAGTAIPTTSGTISSVTVSAPAPGFVTVTASGTVFWPIASAAEGLVRLKVSQTASDTGESPGVQFIRFQAGLGTGTFMFPFSVTKVFPVTAGDHTFYLNGWHQVANGAPSVDDHTLVALYVPNQY